MIIIIRKTFNKKWTPVKAHSHKRMSRSGRVEGRRATREGEATGRATGRRGRAAGGADAGGIV